MEEKIIVAVCGHPELYDTTSFYYRNRNKKGLAWKKVSEEVGETEEVCRKKWKCLRDTYLKEKRKEMEKRSGSAAGSGKKWRYSAVLSFLDPFVSPRETSGNMERGDEESRLFDCVLLKSFPSKIEDDVPDEDRGYEPASTSTGTSMSPGVVRSSFIKRRPSETLEVLERYLSTKNAREREKEEQQHDEVDLFLRSLAPALRRLPASKQSLVKLQIQKILHDAEFGQPSFPQISSVSPSNQLLLQCSVKPS